MAQPLKCDKKSAINNVVNYSFDCDCQQKMILKLASSSSSLLLLYCMIFIFGQCLSSFHRFSLNLSCFIACKADDKILSSPSSSSFTLSKPVKLILQPTFHLMPSILAKRQNSQLLKQTGLVCLSKLSSKSVIQTIKIAFHNANWNSLIYRLAREVSLFILDLILTEALLVRRPIHSKSQLRRLVLMKPINGNELGKTNSFNFGNDQGE